MVSMVSFLWAMCFRQCIFGNLGVDSVALASLYSTSLKSDELAADDTSKNNDYHETEWYYCWGSAADQCDNESCLITWIHMHCLNLDAVPDGHWLCQLSSKN